MRFRVLILVVTILVVAAPAHASVLPAQADIFDQIWQWISQVSDYVWQIQSLYESLRDQLFAKIIPILESGGAKALLEQVRNVLAQLGQLGSPFGWAYENALRNLEALLGRAGEEPKPLSTPWFAENSPVTKEVVNRSIETTIVTSSGVVRSNEAARVSANVAQKVSSAQDVSVSSSQTYGTARQLAGAATNIPSSRAGIQMLIAGTSSMMRAQADSMKAIASRLNALSQQQGATAQQLDAMNKTLEQVARSQQEQMDREERDRQELLKLTGDAVGKSFDAALRYMKVGIIGEGMDSGGGLLSGIKRRK